MSEHSASSTSHICICICISSIAAAASQPPRIGISTRRDNPFDLPSQRSRLVRHCTNRTNAEDGSLSTPPNRQTPTTLLPHLLCTPMPQRERVALRHPLLAWPNNPSQDSASSRSWVYPLQTGLKEAILRFFPRSLTHRIVHRLPVFIRILMSLGAQSRKPLRSQHVAISSVKVEGSRQLALPSGPTEPGRTHCCPGRYSQDIPDDDTRTGPTGNGHRIGRRLRSSETKLQLDSIFSTAEDCRPGRNVQGLILPTPLQLKTDMRLPGILRVSQRQSWTKPRHPLPSATTSTSRCFGLIHDDNGDVIALKLERAPKGNLRHFIEETPGMSSMHRRRDGHFPAKRVTYLHSRGVIWGVISTRTTTTTMSAFELAHLPPHFRGYQQALMVLNSLVRYGAGGRMDPIVFGGDSLKLCDFASLALEKVYPQFGIHTSLQSQMYDVMHENEPTPDRVSNYCVYVFTHRPNTIWPPGGVRLSVSVPTSVASASPYGVPWYLRQLPVGLNSNALTSMTRKHAHTAGSLDIFKSFIQKCRLLNAIIDISITRECVFELNDTTLVSVIEFRNITDDRRTNSASTHPYVASIENFHVSRWLQRAWGLQHA
ncbi:hypothetical protein ACRALDRAFT_2021889 [Sodiomyces alcalophilus JCM 7366]|uniref:uncharacterized protein n=1 Tax=Sodiomyces alcalophilus JCM 7366 TaxID=591952 RepID=UPI0039B3FBDF